MVHAQNAVGVVGLVLRALCSFEAVNGQATSYNFGLVRDRQRKIQRLAQLFNKLKLEGFLTFMFFYRNGYKDVSENSVGGTACRRARAETPIAGSLFSIEASTHFF